jgi:hypothetical protein
LVKVPPLLADLVRRVAATRLEQAGIKLSIVAEVGDLAEPSARGAHTPDLVIIGQAAGRALPKSPLPGSAAVLALSDDLSRLFGPSPDDVAPLTPETLAAALLAVAGEQSSPS